MVLPPKSLHPLGERDLAEKRSLSTAVRGELLLKLLWGADESLGSESANGIYST